MKWLAKKEYLPPPIKTHLMTGGEIFNDSRRDAKKVISPNLKRLVSNRSHNAEYRKKVPRHNHMPGCACNL